MSHDEASDLLGAYALDAVDGDEFAELEAHLDDLPALPGRARQPARGGRRHGQLGGAAARGAVVPDRQPAARAPGGRRAAADAAARARGEPASPFRTPSRPPVQPRAAPCSTLVGAIAVAAAAVAVVLGVGLVRADNKVSNLQCGEAAPSRRDRRVGHARAPGRHPRLELARRSRRRSSCSPPGRATWSRRTCRPSARARPTSSGPSRGTSRSPSACSAVRRSQAAFTMAGSTRPSHLSITAEPAGGSVFPTGPIVATGTV